MLAVWKMLNRLEIEKKMFFSKYLHYRVKMRINIFGRNYIEMTERMAICVALIKL